MGENMSLATPLPSACIRNALDVGARAGARQVPALIAAAESVFTPALQELGQLCSAHEPGARDRRCLRQRRSGQHAEAENEGAGQAACSPADWIPAGACACHLVL